MKFDLRSVAVAAAFAGAAKATYNVDWNDEKSIKSTAADITWNLMQYYTGNNTGDTPGNLPSPYYWWEAGALFGSLIDYWWMTGDDSYNDITMQAMLNQASDTHDFMPLNQTKTEGNDDQGFWAMASMSAAENNFPNPPSKDPGWLAITQAVFNEYASRWDTKDCGGGMRWQIFQWNKGFNYKNSISNGCFFNVAARLARYTGNNTYADWAEKIWEWELKSGLMTEQLAVGDGVTFTSSSCTDRDMTQWTYNNGIFLHGAAVMWNIKKTDTWKTRVNTMLKVGMAKFTKNNVIYENFCEATKQCSTDSQSFKGYLARWMAHTTKYAPWTYDTIMPIIKTSAQAAVKVCSGSGSADAYKGRAGAACGFSWLTSTYDGLVGVGSQMNAMQVVSYTLIKQAKMPVTTKTGGTSKGDAGAGNSDSSSPDLMKRITTGDRVGAGILTILACAGVIGGGYFMISE